MKILFLLLPFLFLQSCSKKQAGKEINQIEPISNMVKAPQGEKLMKVQCYVCHNPSTAMDNRVAPPMIAIRRHYLRSGMSQKEFVNAITTYVKNPSKETSKMPGAVQRFGLMPKMIFNEEELIQIANYLYENEPQKPGWFDRHFEEEHKE